MVNRRSAAAVAALLLASVVAARPSAAAASSHPYANAGAKKIEVKTCSPTRRVTRQPIGFSPGFYPRGPYFWDDAYGYPYYQPPVVINETAELQIDYVNATPVTMASIDFGLIANGRLVAEVRDVGTFSPGIEIKHSFGLNPNVFPLGTALPQCIPLRITYKDQATWVNPHLPALQRAIYQQP